MSDITAGHAEAKLHGFRRTADGVVVSFVLHPAQIPQCLALDPLGTRYMLAFAAIGDDEMPVWRPEPPAPDRPAEPAKDGAVSRQAKERFAALSPQQQAVARAALLAKDERFREWVAKQWRGGGADEPNSAEYIRAWCNVSSRRDIAVEPRAYDAFLRLETEYLVATGQLAEMR